MMRPTFGIREKVSEALAALEAGRPVRDGYRRPAPDGNRHLAYYAIEDICWIYQDRDLAENLRRYGWREARRRVMSQGPPSKEWISHRGRPPVRLTRKGVEVKLEDGVQTFGWQRMESQIQARRS